MRRHDSQGNYRVFLFYPHGFEFFQFNSVSGKWSPSNTVYSFERTMDVSSVCYLAEFQLVFVGLRNGVLNVFKLCTRDESETIMLVNSINNAHGKDSITGITYSDQLLWTCGRDGSYCVWFILNAEGKMEPIHRDRPKGWLERSIFMTGDLVVCGFSEKNFHAYNTDQREILLDVQCGGGHRRWDLKNTDEHVSFVFPLKNKVN